MKIALEPQLETERLILRKIHKSDVEDVIEIFSCTEIFRYTNSDVDLTSDFFHIENKHAISMIDSWYNDNDLMCWGIETKNDKRLIGRIYLYDIIGNATAGYRVDIGYSISTKHWGYGYATESVIKIVDYGFASFNIIRFQAEILPENIASIKVCEKSGFKNEGILRKHTLYNNNGNSFRDIVMMAIVRN